MKEVKIKLLNDKAKVPTKAIYNDACYDVVATSRKDYGDGRIEYGFGLAFELNENTQLDVRARSSIHKTGLILSNCIGTGDEGYRGEYKVVFYHVIPTLPAYDVGDRVAQIQIKSREDVEFVVVEELSESVRGEGGWGHSGLKELDTKTLSLSDTNTHFSEEEIDNFIRVQYSGLSKEEVFKKIEENHHSREKLKTEKCQIPEDDLRVMKLLEERQISTIGKILEDFWGMSPPEKQREFQESVKQTVLDEIEKDKNNGKLKNFANDLKTMQDMFVDDFNLRKPTLSELLDKIEMLARIQLDSNEVEIDSLTRTIVDSTYKFKAQMEGVSSTKDYDFPKEIPEMDMIELLKENDNTLKKVIDILTDYRVDNSTQNNQ